MTPEGPAAARATAAFGGDPDGVWAAPGRVNLIGEHTDYNAGYVLPFALPQRTAVAAARQSRREWMVWSEASGEAVTFDLSLPVPGWAAYVAGVVWALRDAGYDPPGARLTVASDVPVGSGLSSSAALECAVLTALVDIGGLDLPLDRRPALAQRAENAYVGVPCGVLDQSAAILCRAGHALFLDCRSGATEHIPFSADGEAAVVVIDTRAPHRHAGGEYAARRAACEAAAAELGLPALRDATPADVRRLRDDVTRRRARHVVTENQRVLDTIALLRAGRTAGIGPLLTASHASLRDDFEVTVPELDVAVDAALTAGAYGARMTGGGFGGCVIALAAPALVDDLTAAVADAFARAGYPSPVSFPVTPTAGASRVA